MTCSAQSKWEALLWSSAVTSYGLWQKPCGGVYTDLPVDFPGGSDGKTSAYNVGDSGSILVGKISWRRKWQPTPVFLPGKSHGLRGLVGCSPWGCKELDTLSDFTFTFHFSCIGEGNGNPLQCSCLENPGMGEPGGLPSMGVTQSRTRLKWLSGSSSSLYLGASLCGLVGVVCLPFRNTPYTIARTWKEPRYPSTE